jgi:hypothetical protein
MNRSTIETSLQGVPEMTDVQDENTTLQAEDDLEACNTAARAAHIDGLAYSQWEPDTGPIAVVDYPATGPTPIITPPGQPALETQSSYARRGQSWWATLGVAGTTFGLAVAAAIVLVILGVIFLRREFPEPILPSQDTTVPMISVPMMTPTPPPFPAPTRTPTILVQPPMQHETPAPPEAAPRPDPDTVFVSTWADQMPNYPWPNSFCEANNVPDGCWLELAKPSAVEPTARGMCALVADRDKTYATQVLLRDRAHSPDLLVRAMTPAQAKEFVDISVHAYCPEEE